MPAMPCACTATRFAAIGLNARTGAAPNANAAHAGHSHWAPITSCDIERTLDVTKIGQGRFSIC